MPHPFLLPYDVHLWSVALDSPSEPLERLWGLLSLDEQVRARRFHFERDRNRYVVGRAVLRTLIGRYLSLPPTTLVFDYGTHGKPELSSVVGGRKLAFNLSNTQDQALIGFCWGGPIGVDIEQIRPLNDAHDIAKRFFSANENAIFQTIPPEQIPQAFFNCWTRKEAFIKAVGEGLSYPLDQFDVTLAPGEPARILQIRGSQQEANQWVLHTLFPVPGYVGAVVMPKQPNISISFFEHRRE